jgi:hypothetical protein
MSEHISKSSGKRRSMSSGVTREHARRFRNQWNGRPGRSPGSRTGETPVPLSVRNLPAISVNGCSASSKELSRAVTGVW